MTRAIRSRTSAPRPKMSSRNRCFRRAAILSRFIHLLSQRCAWAAAHPEFTVGFLFAKVNPSEYSDGEAIHACLSSNHKPKPLITLQSRALIASPRCLQASACNKSCALTHTLPLLLALALMLPPQSPSKAASCRRIAAVPCLLCPVLNSVN